jgi:hypothetical protein
MVWSHRVRMFLVVVLAVSLTVLVVPAAAQAAPTAGRAAPPPAATPAAVGQPPQPVSTAVGAHPALGPTRAGTVGGRSLDITLALVAGGAAVQVTITPLVDLPAATLRVVTAQGRQELNRSQVGLGALRPGVSIRRTVALRVPDGDVGVVAAVLAGQQLLGSRFVALRRHGGQVLAAGSLAQLDDAALAADRRSGTLSQAAYAHQVVAAHRAPGAAGTVAPAALATTTLTVSGTASYRDRNGSVRPVRSGTVELVDSGGVVHITGTTRDDGSFTLSTSEVFGSMTVAVRISTQSAYGVVFQPNGSYWTAYSALQTVTSGSTWSGVSIVLNRDTEANRGFAVLDELRTLGAYYQSIRDPGWPVTRLGVTYPSGTVDSSTDRGTRLIDISGGETLCTYPDGHTDWCPEDAYDWDVAAHESGHVVAFQGGFDASAGGAHNVCTNAWGTTTDQQITRDKDAAVKLAWSEGWATFYGVSALWLQGVPSWAYPDAGDTSYNDRPGPPHNNTYRNVNYSLEGADYCATTPQASPHGDDSEMAISRALWDLWDTANDGETLSWSFGDILGRLKAAKPTTFTAAWAALSSGRSASDLDQAGRVLETWGFAPTGMQPSGTVGDSPARFSWSRGGIPAHPNDTFTLRVRDMLGPTPLEGRVLWQVTTTGTSYQPDAVTWEAIARAQNVIVDVSGAQSTAPVSGPFWSHGYKLTILPNGRYVPVTPTRILSGFIVDLTRAGVTLAPLGKGGVPSSGVSAVAFQLTAAFDFPGALSVDDGGGFGTGTLALTDSIGQQQGVTNLVVAKLSSAGTVSIRYSQGNGAALVFADVVGYYVFSPQASTASTYVPLTPARILNAADITAGGSIPVAPLGKGGIPTTGVTAVLAHVIVRSGARGNATVYPDGATKPGTWDVYFGTDYYYANLVPAKLGSNGQFRISTSVAARVYVDVVGYFRTPAGTTGESTFVGLRPWRIVSGVTVPAGATYTLSPLGAQSPDGTRAIPSTGVAAVAFTLTACASAIGAISVYPAGVTDPATGNLYYHPSYNGHPTCWSLLQSAKLGSNGQIVLHNRGSVSVSISVDVDGYYRT